MKDKCPPHTLTRSIIRLLLRLLIVPSRSLRPILLIRPILAPIRIRKRFPATATATAASAIANPRPTAPTTAAAPVETSAVAAASLVMWAGRQVGVRRPGGFGDVVVFLISIVIVDRRPALLIKAGRTGRRLLAAAPCIVARLLHINILVFKRSQKEKT